MITAILLIVTKIITYEIPEGNWNRLWKSSAQDRERETTIHKYQKQSYKDCYQIDYTTMGNYFQILLSSL